MPGRWKSEAIGTMALVEMALLGFGRIATAEPESVRIEYSAPAECPDATAFMRSVKERTTRFREAAPDQEARRFLVHVQALGALFHGQLEIRLPDGRTTLRNVDAAVCDEVSSALALITALTIDPNALTGGSRRNREDTSDDSPRSPPSPSASVTATPPPESHEASPPWRWSAGAVGHTTFVVSPTRGYGGSLFVETEAPDASRLGPSVRMGIFLNKSDVDLPQGAGADFQWALAEVDGCPARLGGARLALHPCVAFRLGVIHGESRGISHPQQRSSLWSDVGPLLRVRLAATDRLLLEAQAGLVIPLHRTTFEITDMGASRTAYSVPRLGGSAGIGVAYRFR